MALAESPTEMELSIATAMEHTLQQLLLEPNTVLLRKQSLFQFVFSTARVLEVMQL
jgi:hypothetical protein